MLSFAIEKQTSKKFLDTTFKLFFLILNSFYFLMLMNTGSSICQIGKGWVPCGPSSLFLFTLNYLFEHDHSHTGLTLIIA